MAKLGFDIGGSSLKIAVVREREVRLEEMRLPENMMDEGGVILPHVFAGFLKQAKKELALPRGDAALALPPRQAICRLVTMPRMTTEQLLLNLPYEFSDFIQGEADQYFCDYAVCASTEEDEGEGIPMMAAVAAKSRLAEYARIFSQAGLRLKTVLPQEMALVNLCRNRPEGAEEYFFVDLGYRHTQIIVVWGDGIQATRQIPMGGRDIDLAIGDELGVDAFLAGTYKLTNYQNVQSAPVVADLCERIAVEILKVLNFYRFTYRSSSLGGLFLVGGGAALPPLERAIASAVDLPLLDPASLLPGAFQGAASGVFAAGVAMGGK